MPRKYKSFRSEFSELSPSELEALSAFTLECYMDGLTPEEALEELKAIDEATPDVLPVFEHMLKDHRKLIVYVAEMVPDAMIMGLRELLK
ncbi:MAG: hypothetical protein KGL39_16425 [Patescibacteria group bacterium]|nr:hypothetical protein [Patescibacteria group bacterium]